MVGGTVVEICNVPGQPDVYHIDVVDGRDKCGVRAAVTPESDRIQIGDSVWWQCGFVYWTPQRRPGEARGPRGGVDYDIKIPKIGYSGAPHPTASRA